MCVESLLILKNLLFFNRYPILDKYVKGLISKNLDNFTISRSIPCLVSQLQTNQFEWLLINVDEHMKEILFIVELLEASDSKTKIILFGHYKSHLSDIINSGIEIFLLEHSNRQEFKESLDAITSKG